METTTQTIDLSKLSAEQLKAELEKREKQKDQDREAYKQLVEQTVPNAFFKLAYASEQLSNAKTETFKYFEEVLDLKAKVYGIKEKQQTHTFSTGKQEITIGYRINDGWDDTVNTGIEKVKKYITSLSKDNETAALVNIIMSLLKQDTKGNLKSSRVLELQKLTKEINNAEFADGVSIIAEAFKPKRSVWFIEASVIHEDGSKTPVPLNISQVEFSQGYNFDYHAEELEKILVVEPEIVPHDHAV
jgi:hypothetical protein